MGGGYGNSRRRACGVLWAAILAALCALVTASSVADLVLARGYTPHQPASPASPASPTDAPQLLYAQQPCTPVYAAPSLQSTLLTDLPGGADVTPLEL